MKDTVYIYEAVETSVKKKKKSRKSEAIWSLKTLRNSSLIWNRNGSAKLVQLCSYTIPEQWILRIKKWINKREFFILILQLNSRKLIVFSSLRQCLLSKHGQKYKTSQTTEKVYSHKHQIHFSFAIWEIYY